MKKRIKQLGLLLCANLFVIGSLSAQTFTIEGSIDMDVEGFENELIELFEFDNRDSRLIQQTKIVDGKFTFTGTTPFPKNMCLYNVLEEDSRDMPTDIGYFFLTNDHYNIHISKDDFKVTSKSTEQIQYQIYQDLRTNRDKALDELMAEYKAKHATTYTKEEQNELNNWARDKDFQIHSNYQDESTKWLEKNLNLYVGVQIYYINFMRNIRKRQAENLFAEIPEHLTQSKYYQAAKLWLEARNNIKAGKEAPQAEVYDIEGNMFPLLEKGKKQVIFFGTRDMYFYKPFEKYSRIYNKYADKDIEWKAVAKGDRNKWVRYLSLDPTPYPTYLSDDNNSSGLFNLYNLHVFPSVLVVDQNNLIEYIGPFTDANWDELIK